MHGRIYAENARAAEREQVFLRDEGRRPGRKFIGTDINVHRRPVPFLIKSGVRSFPRFAAVSWYTARGAKSSARARNRGRRAKFKTGLTICERSYIRAARINRAHFRRVRQGAAIFAKV